VNSSSLFSVDEGADSPVLRRARERRPVVRRWTTGLGPKVALLTGGKDAHYVLGLLPELAARGVRVALAGGADLAAAEDVTRGRVEFHDLVGDLDPNDGRFARVWRVLRYYGLLLSFAARAEARVFHILWFRKFPVLERILLAGYLNLLGKKIAFTAHNVDDRARDGRAASSANGLSLRFLYRGVDHIFVHTPQMKDELLRRFRVPADKVEVVPFGVNDCIPVSPLSQSQARQRLGLHPDEKVLLFFGNIAPYKGAEDLLRALGLLVGEDSRFRLVLAGRVKDPTCEPYWAELTCLIDTLGLSAHVRQEIRYVPDEEASLLFRAADVSVLPYRRVDQSGVVALSYAQGVPVVASDAGSLRADVVVGETGFVFKSGDVSGLADALRRYFASALYADREARRSTIRTHAAKTFSWAQNADLTCAAYERLLEGGGQ